MNMKLFGRKKKVNTPTNSIHQPLDKLVNGELPFGWYAHNKHITKPKEDRMVELALKTKTPDEEIRIAALQELIQYFYSYQAECQSMGECFAKYFDERYMHCMNSRCDDFVYITPYEQELKELKGNR